MRAEPLTRVLAAAAASAIALSVAREGAAEEPSFVSSFTKRETQQTRDEMFLMLGVGYTSMLLPQALALQYATEGMAKSTGTRFAGLLALDGLMVRGSLALTSNIVLNLSFGYAGASHVPVASTTNKAARIGDGASVTGINGSVDAGIRIPVNIFDIRGGAGLGFASWDRSIGSVDDGSVQFFDFPLWSSVQVKPFCDWGLELSGSYHLQPDATSPKPDPSLSFNSVSSPTRTHNGFNYSMLGVSIVFQPNERCKK